MKRVIVAALAAVLGIAGIAVAGSSEPTLVARAVLPADTFAPGPPSGNFITPAFGRGPFASQPVQGISSVLDAGRGSYWAMPDNGFGAKENSPDFLLRIYKITPDFETVSGGSGTVAIDSFVQLRDPNGKIPFALTRSDRVLTGSDFDIESVRIDRAGGFWFGDEFGPWLVHTDADGVVLEAPIPLAGVKSPQNQTLAPGEVATLRRSQGFEGSAISPNRKTLYPMLEGALVADPDQQRRWINEFDLSEGEYTGVRWAYRMEAASNAIGELTALDEKRFLVIERDNAQGPAAAFKRIFLVDLREVGADGYLVKREIVNLLQIADPDEISLPARPGDFGLGEQFSFPFQTIESVLPLDGTRLLIANDNNYPFSAGRNAGRPDDNELIIVRIGAIK